MIHDEMRKVEVLVELKWGMISGLFNALLLMAEILHQLRFGSLSHWFMRFYISQVVSRISSINSVNSK